MEKRKTYKVVSSWFRKKDKYGHLYSTWCKQISEDEVYCTICNKKISCITKGLAALTQHENTTVHKDSVASRLGSTQLLLKPPVVPAIESDNPLSTSKLQLCHPREAAIKAELVWAMRMVQYNISTTFADDLGDVFKAMFTTVPPGFSLGRTKLSYLITEALGPYFRKELLADAKKSFFTLLYDETTNNAGKKELQFMIRYWSEDEDQIVCRHLCSVFLGHAKAENILHEINEVISSNNLSFKKLIMLSSDGPQVNKKVFRLVNEVMIDERGQGLVDVGTCNLHVVNNSFQKGLEEYGEVACDLVVDVYHFFKKFPSRWEDFQTVQVKKNVPSHTFLKHVPSRWLTAGAACERMLEQWDAVLEYFLIFIPNQEKRLLSSPKYRRITLALKANDILVELNFVIESYQVFQKFLKLFQSPEPLVHALHSELHNILKTIKGRVCKPDTDKNEEITVGNLLKACKIDCCDTTKKSLNALNENDKTAACNKIQRHFMAAHNYLMTKCSSDILRYCQCLQPSEISSNKSLRRIEQLAKAFSFTGVSAMAVKDEWRILQSEVPVEEKDTRIDKFWKRILSRKTSFNVPKYPALEILVKACLTLAHGNADVERSFSVSRRVLSDDKCRMSGRVLNERLLIRDSLKKYGNVTEVVITKELITLAQNAHKSYENFLAEEKKKTEELERQQIEKVEKMRKEQERLADLKCKKQSIDNLETKISAVEKVKKLTKSSTTSLLKEANERLKLGIKKNDLNAVRIAQGMLEGAEKLRQQEQEHEEKEAKLKKIVNKRKSNIIDTIMKRKKI